MSDDVVAVFARENVDMDTMKEMTEENLQGIGVTKEGGHVSYRRVFAAELLCAVCAGWSDFFCPDKTICQILHF